MWQAHVARRERALAERSRDRNEALVEFMLGDLQEELAPSNRMDVVAKLTAAVLKSLDEVPAGERNDVTRAQRARVLLLSSSVRRYQGDTEGAERELREAVQVLEALPRTDRVDGGRVDRSLAAASGHLALLLEDKGDLAGAIVAAQDAVARWTAVRVANPEDVEIRAGLADAWNQLGRDQLVAGKTADSLAAHLAAIREVEGLSAEARATRDVAITLYDSHLFAGRAFEFSGELERAAEQFEIGVELAAAFSDAHPGDLIARHQISVLTNDRGRVLRKSGDFAAARAAFERGLVIVREVAAKDPGNLMYQSDLAASHCFLGRVAELEGDLPRALAENREDVAINEELVRKEPENGSFRSYLAVAINNEGRVLMASGASTSLWRGTTGRSPCVISRCPRTLRRRRPGRRR